jgi:hypothetical protein
VSSISVRVVSLFRDPGIRGSKAPPVFCTVEFERKSSEGKLLDLLC